MEREISVIIPTYYRNDLLEVALKSVFQQDYDPLEIIVVDDSGKGHAKPILKKYDDIHGIIREDNGGWGTALTTGYQASSGEIIQFLDDDDKLLKGKLQKTAEVLLDSKDTGVVYCGVELEDGKRVYPEKEMRGDVLKNLLLFDNFPCYTVSMIFDRDILGEMMPLPTLPAANDINLMIELAQMTYFDYVDECLVFKRESPDAMWSGLNKIEGMKQVIARHRSLYDEYPEDILNSILAETYELEGRYVLDKHLWSARAVSSFAKSTYLAPENKHRHFAEFIASLLGKPGLDILRRAKTLVKE